MSDIRTTSAAILERIDRNHPRVFGSLARLRQLAQERPAAFQRMARVARELPIRDDPSVINRADVVTLHAKAFSIALTSAVEGDAKLARTGVELIFEQYLNKPIPYGHVPFGHDVAVCAVMYDHTYLQWSPAEREKLFNYIGLVVDANRFEEVSVFHNGWYGYKNWGFGVACLATLGEWPRAASLWDALDHEYRERAAPAMDLSGDGGSIGEGYYVNYWLYQWTVFLEAARLCAGVDYAALAPRFHQQRAVASMFETFPGFEHAHSRRAVCVGDGRGRFYEKERDAELSARRILAARYPEDALNRAAQEFNNRQPEASAAQYGYRDFLWNDPKAPAEGLAETPLSHYSRGPGLVFMRSSWAEDAVWFMFKCGPRFTAHQHLDAAHFSLCYKGELIGEAGHYDSFGQGHDANFYARSGSHNTLRVEDPREKVPDGFRGFKPTVNDGGQHHDWVGLVHHNGDSFDVPGWYKHREIFDTGQILACEDHGAFAYTAGDATRAYRSAKVKRFVRQIIFLRPGTFIMFDQVESTQAEFKKTWLLQAIKKPEQRNGKLVITNGEGRVFVQTLLPERAETKLVCGEEMYKVAGENFPPKLKFGIEVECRVEVAAVDNAAKAYFLHVFTAVDSNVNDVPTANVKVSGNKVEVSVGEARATFELDRTGGQIALKGQTMRLRD